MTLALALLTWLGLPWFATAVGIVAGSRSVEVTDQRLDDLAGEALEVAAGASVAALTVWLLLPELLTRTVGLTASSCWAASVVVSIASVGYVLLPRQRRALRRAVRVVAPTSLLIAAVGLITWAPVGWRVLRISWGPLGSTPWYYWSLAQQIADAHHVPASSVEWGESVPFLGDYHFFSTSTAALILQAPKAGVAVIQAVTLVCVLVLALSAVGLARALGGGRVASYAAIPLTIGTGIAALRLSSYRPEAMGLGMTLLLVTCWVLWLRSNRPAYLLLSALTALDLAGVHGIALLAGGILGIAAAMAWVRRPLARYLRRVAVGGVVMGLGAVIGGVLLAPKDGAAQLHGLPDRSGFDDATWEFVRSIGGHRMSEPPSNAFMAKTALYTAYRDPVALRFVVVAALVIALGALTWRAVHRDRERRILSFFGLALVGMGMMTLFFALGWQGYVPRRTGGLRLVQEATLLVGPFLAVAVPPVLGGAQHRARERGLHVPGPIPAVVVTLLVLVLAMATGLVGSQGTVKHTQWQHPSEEAYRTLRDAAIPPGSVTLANAYTEGYFQQVAQAHGLLEGRAPYTFADILKRANLLLKEGRAFYAHPRAHLDLLSREKVDYVVVSGRGSYSLGTGNTFVSPLRLYVLDHLPQLTLVTRAPGLRVYKVDRTALPD